MLNIFLKVKNGALGRDKIIIDLFKELDLDIYKVAYFINKDLRKGMASLKEAELILVFK